MSQALLHDYPTPPFFYLLHVADNCSSALSTYLKLWRDKHGKKPVSVAKKYTVDDYGIDEDKFRHDISLLLDQGIIQKVTENHSKYFIEFLEWEAMHDELA